MRRVYYLPAKDSELIMLEGKTQRSKRIVEKNNIKEP